MPPPDPRPVLVGVDEESLVVAAFFDAFDWEGRALDPEAQSAADFLGALGD